MKERKNKGQTRPKAVTKYYSCDFETSVYEGQDHTEVWAAAEVNLDAPDETDSVKIYQSIDSFMFNVCQRASNCNQVLYFHNLKFDGSFIVSYLERSNYWKLDSYAVFNDEDEYCGEAFQKKSPYKMENGTYRYSVSDKGMWYSITLKTRYHVIEIRDSLKLLPFSVRQLGKDFKLKHQKLDMEYEGYRFPGCFISKKEREYIANDVLVVKEALNFMFSQGHDKLTIGACCMAEYKSQYSKEEWEVKFPNLYETQVDVFETCKTVGEFVRNTYKGGWCYVVPEKANRELRRHGTTCDVNSLYPSMMHSDSGNRYPIGSPTFWQGDIPQEAKQPDKYYFVHVRTRFYIKDGMLPTVMIKNSSFYPSREWLTTSDVIDRRIKGDDKYKRENRKKYYIDENGEVRAARPDLYLTMTDWELLQEHYNLEDTEIIEGCYFNTEIGLFDDYINKYAEIKKKSKGAMRQLAKLFLNNLYGKFATSTDSSYKVMYLNDKGEIRSYSITGYDKTPGYIPIGSAITSYARAFTIKAAQANYHGPDHPGFIYADTDSIHCDLLPEEIVGAPKHPTAFNHWKYETCWDYAKFIRAKTYVEHVTHEDEEKIDKPYYNMKCAGMSDHVKNLFLHSVTQSQITPVEYAKLDREEQEFISEHRSMDDFRVGLEAPGMLKAKNIRGGVLLVKSWYCMHKTIGD